MKPRYVYFVLFIFLTSITYNSFVSSHGSNDSLNEELLFKTLQKNNLSVGEEYVLSFVKDKPLSVHEHNATHTFFITLYDLGSTRISKLISHNGSNFTELLRFENSITPSISILGSNSKQITLFHKNSTSNCYLSTLNLSTGNLTEKMYFYGDYCGITSSIKNSNGGYSFVVSAQSQINVNGANQGSTQSSTYRSVCWGCAPICQYFGYPSVFGVMGIDEHGNELWKYTGSGFSDNYFSIFDSGNNSTIVSTKNNHPTVSSQCGQRQSWQIGSTTFDSNSRMYFEISYNGSVIESTNSGTVQRKSVPLNSNHSINLESTNDYCHNDDCNLTIRTSKTGSIVSEIDLNLSGEYYIMAPISVNHGEVLVPLCLKTSAGGPAMIFGSIYYGSTTLILRITSNNTVKILEVGNHCSTSGNNNHVVGTSKKELNNQSNGIYILGSINGYYLDNTAVQEWEGTQYNLRKFSIDSDDDHLADSIDPFPFDASQQFDADGDGYGDNANGLNPDDCPQITGYSWRDRNGCSDSDSDGQSDTFDAFPLNPTQWDDSDFDGFGDNVTGFRGDSCPEIYGLSTRDRYGCPDSDGDGTSDENDVFQNNTTQWSDEDSDGYGDNPVGEEPDDCRSKYGTSWRDRFGCVDSDGDGWSDDGDAFPNESTQYSDRDLDGYGDNQSNGANLIDAFPGDTTQWNDTDGDGYGDNQNGNLPDRFPNDPTRWSDSDHDGVADEDDEFPDDGTQFADTDGDGYGDDPNGNRADAFPNDPEEWLDTDGDGLGNNADAFPFDPTQTEDRDGDGMGDNPMGIGADKFPDDITQWGDIDGDGYGDNQTGNNPDAFPTDATQWSDVDGDGYGDNPTGRLPDAFPNDPTQWEDLDGDGLGDNLTGNNADPYLFDFDNDGYNDSIDPLPKLASPGDLDNDGVPDEDDLFPDDYREWADFDGDGEGDNADTDDDNDGWTDTDEARQGTDPFSSASQPVDSFEIVIPGTAIGLGAWDLIGIFGGVPLFAWIGFGFATRNARTARYEEMLRGAQSIEDLEQVSHMWEYSLMMRMLGPHQGIRLERLRADLEYEFSGQRRISIVHESTDQTELVSKEVPALQTSEPVSSIPATQITEDGYEWLDYDGQKYYRLTGSATDWIKFE